MIIRVNKKENPYVMIDKYPLNDPSLSAKATGILCYLLSKPNNWKIRVVDLEKHFRDGEKSIKAGLRELIARGYLQRIQRFNGNRQFNGFEYTIYEKPAEKDTESLKQAYGEKIPHQTESLKTAGLKQASPKCPTNNNDISKNEFNNNKHTHTTKQKEEAVPQTDINVESLSAPENNCVCVDNSSLAGQENVCCGGTAQEPVLSPDGPSTSVCPEMSVCVNNSDISSSSVKENCKDEPILSQDCSSLNASRKHDDMIDHNSTKANLKTISGNSLKQLDKLKNWFNSKQIQKLRKQYPTEYLIEKIELANNSNVHNPAGFLICALKGNWKPLNGDNELTISPGYYEWEEKYMSSQGYARNKEGRYVRITSSK